LAVDVSLGAHRGENSLGQDAGPLVALVRLLVAEGQTDVALAALAGKERSAGCVLHARLERQRFEPGHIRRGRQLDPDEESALRPADLDRKSTRLNSSHDQI